MKIIKPSYKINMMSSYQEKLQGIEEIGRTAYKSEDKITKDSAEKFVRMLIKKKHESVLEHEFFRVKFICDRGVSHELVRHRLMAVTQESTRYCNYKKKGIAIIEPCFFQEKTLEYRIWKSSMENAESCYNSLIECGRKPEEARTVLPHSTKTEVICTANIRQWRHILDLRTAPESHPQMRELMVSLLVELKKKMPVFFEDLKER